MRRKPSRRKDTASFLIRHMFRLVVYVPLLRSSSSDRPYLPPPDATLPRRNRTTGHTHYQRKTHQLVRIDHSKLQLLHATQAGRGVTEVLRGHAQGRGPDAGGGWGAGAAAHGLFAVGFSLLPSEGEEKINESGAEERERRAARLASRNPEQLSPYRMPAGRHAAMTAMTMTQPRTIPRYHDTTRRGTSWTRVLVRVAD